MWGKDFDLERNIRLNHFLEARRYVFAPLAPPPPRSPSSTTFSPSQIGRAINTTLLSSTSEFQEEEEEEEEEEGEQVMAANQTLRGLASNRRA